MEGNLITAIHMSPNAIITISRAALVKFWQRPPRQGVTGRQRANGKEKERERVEREMRSPRTEFAIVA